jgi:hypothetical protein
LARSGPTTSSFIRTSAATGGSASIAKGEP